MSQCLGDTWSGVRDELVNRLPVSCDFASAGLRKIYAHRIELELFKPAPTTTGPTLALTLSWSCATDDYKSSYCQLRPWISLSNNLYSFDSLSTSFFMSEAFTAAKIFISDLDARRVLLPNEFCKS